MSKANDRPERQSLRTNQGTGQFYDSEPIEVKEITNLSGDWASSTQGVRISADCQLVSTDLS